MIVRLWEREGAEVKTLERTPAELARARAVGGRVFDVTVDVASRAAALRVLAESRLVVDEEKDPAEFDRVARLRRRVAEVI